MTPLLQVRLFAAKDGSCPLLTWLDGLPPTAQQRFLAKVCLLRPPEPVDLGATEIVAIRKLEIACDNNKYRIAYFFQDSCAVLLHGWLCGSIPESVQLDLAVKRKIEFKMNPAAHTYFE